MQYFKLFFLSFLFIIFSAKNILALDNGSDKKFRVKAKIFGLPSTHSFKNTLNDVQIAVENPATAKSYYYQKYKNVNNTTSIGSGLGMELSGSYFFSDKIALELGAAYITKNIKSSGSFQDGKVGSNDTNPNYNNLTTKFNGQYLFTTTQAKIIPFTLTLQHHLAPYGKISPYYGVGMHYTMFTISKDQSKMNSSRGLVLQSGFDSMVGDRASINLDLKKYFMKTNFTFASNPNASTSSDGAISPGDGAMIMPTQKLNFSPWIISLGLGYRF